MESKEPVGRAACSKLTLMWQSPPTLAPPQSSNGEQTDTRVTALTMDDGVIVFPFFALSWAALDGSDVAHWSSVITRPLELEQVGQQLDCLLVCISIRYRCRVLLLSWVKLANVGFCQSWDSSPTPAVTRVGLALRGAWLSQFSVTCLNASQTDLFMIFMNHYEMKTA
jgi:hypothetical protein